MTAVKTSLKSKLIRSTTVTLTVVGLLTLVSVAWLQYRGAESHQKDVESYIKEGIDKKGQVLASNHALALQGLFEDNAFSAVQELISKTVGDDADLAYGLVLDENMKPWIFAENQSGKLIKADKAKAGKALGTLGISEEMLEAEKGVTARKVMFNGEEIYEFSAHIIVDEEDLGSLRYGLSTRRMQQAVASAAEASQSALIQALAILSGICLLGIIGGVLNTRRTAQNITGPLNALTEAAHAIAEGDRSRSVQISSGDELEVLGGTFNQMVADLNASYAELEEMNAGLEQMVEERTRDLKQKTDDVVAMLQNIQQGLFTVLPGMEIHPEYSAHLESILGTAQIAGRSLHDVLFIATDLGSDAINSAEVALGCTLGEDAMMFEWNNHLLPTVFHYETSDGRDLILEADWNPIVEEDDTLSRLMVSLRDVTEIRRLQAEGAAQERQLAIVGQLLAMKPGEFERFYDNSSAFIARNRELVAVNERPGDEVITELFRNMHTVKGNARFMGLKFLNDLVHEAEEDYDRFRQDAEAEWSSEALITRLDGVQKALDEYRDVQNEKLGGRSASSDGGAIQSALEGLLEQVRSGAEFSNEALISRLEAVGRAGEVETLGSILENTVEGLAEIAEALNKPTPEVVIEPADIEVPAELAPTLRDVFNHMLRNAVDHGIEKPDDRTHAGKDPQGRITLQVDASEGELVVEIFDDGRGLNLMALGAAHEALHTAAGKEAPAHPADEELARVIFASGVSTAKTVTDISGRGVGMEAVKAFLQSKGGDVEVRFRGPRQGAYRPFALVMRHPI
ncbi:MAG: HAMP domain-containing protein [Bradymonadia bacterium]